MDFLFPLLARYIRHARRSAKITASAMPMPIPAFAPIERPLPEFAVGVEAEVGVARLVELVAGVGIEEAGDAAVVLPGTSCTTRGQLVHIMSTRRIALVEHTLALLEGNKSA